MKDKILIVLSTVQTLTLITILIVLLNNGSFGRPKQAVAHMEAQTRKQEPIKLNENDAIWGSNDAPYTLVAYLDYECPFCKEVYKNIKELEDEYIKTGKVKVIIRDLPLKMHPNAKTIAAAAECARKQGKFWEFANVALMNNEKFKDGMLDNWSKLLDIDFESCIDDSATIAVVTKDIQNARSRGLKGTPALFINDTYYRGTMPTSDLKAIFEGKKPTKKKSGVCN